MRSALKPRLLFTAPHVFLGSLSPYDDPFDITYREAWLRDDLEPDAMITFWMPNPGQHFVVDADALDLYPRLHAVGTPSTGSNHIDKEACRARGVGVLSLLDDRAALEGIAASAEFTFLHVLNSFRRIDVGYEAVRSRAWRDDEDQFRGRELAGRRIGLVGCGRIGRRLVRYFHAFDCVVRAYDPYADLPAGVDSADSLIDLAGGCDVLVICCALTDETTGMIGADVIAALPVEAVIVNTSRGEILREDEVVRSLYERTDLTFAADVITGETDGTYTRSPLLDAHHDGRALVTPHIAGATVESQRKAAVTILRLLAASAQSS